MEVSLILIASTVIGGFVLVWIFETIIDLAVTSRVMDDPFRGKMLATIVAYFLAAILIWMATNSPSAFYGLLPGAILVGLFEGRSARKMLDRMSAADETTTFE